MNLIKILNNKPQVIDNGNIINYEEICIQYKNGQWLFSIKINENWHDVITTDDETIIELDN